MTVAGSDGKMSVGTDARTEVARFDVRTARRFKLCS